MQGPGLKKSGEGNLVWVRVPPPAPVVCFWHLHALLLQLREDFLSPRDGRGAHTKLGYAKLDQLRDHGCLAGSLPTNTHPDTNFPELRSFVLQLAAALLDELFSGVQFHSIHDHGKHNSQVAVRGGAQDRAQLRLEELGHVQTHPDAAPPQEWVLFLGLVHAGQVLVPAHVQRADYDRPLAERLGHFAVSPVLFLLRRQLRPLHKQELCAEESHSLRSPLESALRLFRRADVGCDLDALTVSGTSFDVLELRKDSLLFGYRLLLSLELDDRIGVRVGDRVPLATVQGDDFSLERFLQRRPDPYHRRDAEGACHDRDVRSLGALGDDETQSHAFGDANGVRGSQVTCQDYGGLLEHFEPGSLATHQIGGDLGRHVAHIVGPGGHVLVLHLGEHPRELLTHGQYRGLRTRQIPHALLDFGMELGVLGHLDVRVEDSGLLLAPRFPQPLCRLRELLHYGLDGALETCQLLLNLVFGDVLTLGLELSASVDENRTHRNSLGCRDTSYSPLRFCIHKAPLFASARLG